MRPLPSQPVSILFLSSFIIVVCPISSLLGPDDAIGDGVHVPPRLVRAVEVRPRADRRPRRRRRAKRVIEQGALKLLPSNLKRCS